MSKTLGDQGVGLPDPLAEVEVDGLLADVVKEMTKLMEVGRNVMER